MYFIAGLQMAGGICFFSLCLMLHMKSPDIRWLLASGLLSVGIVLVGAYSALDEYEMSNTVWEIREDGSKRPIRKNIQDS